MDSSVVDLDDRSTWPETVSAFVVEFEGKLRGSTEFTSDLEGGLIDREGEFRSLLAGHKLLAFHSTCLFDHEVDAIRREGLRRLSRALVEQKIKDAHAHGALSVDERARCLERNAYAIDNMTGREDQVCLVVGRKTFDEEAAGLSPLLGGWGGEATNGGPGPGEDPVLGTLGRPAIVAVGLDVAAGHRSVYTAPSLAKVFVGSGLGLRDAFGEIHFFADIPADDVLAIWEPGDEDYDRHRGLPRARRAEVG